MRDLSNESFSQYRCVEAALLLRAVAQRLKQESKVAKTHERNFYERPFE